MASFKYVRFKNSTDDDSVHLLEYKDDTPSPTGKFYGVTVCGVEDALRGSRNNGNICPKCSSDVLNLMNRKHIQIKVQPIEDND